MTFFVITIFVSAVFGGFLVKYYSDQFIQDISERNLDLAHHVKEGVKIFLDHHLAELLELRLLLDHYGLQEIELMREELDRINAFHPLLEQVQILDFSGSIVQVSPFKEEYLGLDMSGHESFQKAVELSDNEIHWSDSFISTQTNDPAVTMSLPIKNGVLMAHLNLNERSDLVSFSQPVKGEVTSITDRRGVVIAHPSQVVVQQRVNWMNLESIRSGTANRLGTHREIRDGTMGLASVIMLEESGWVVSVFQPEKVALGVLYHARRVVALSFSILLILTMIIFLTLQRQGMKPIRRLEEKANMIATGLYGEDLDSEFMELSGFVESFNVMTRAVGSREEQLKASEERFRILFDEAAEPVYLMDRQGDLIAANKRAEKDLGYSPEEFKNMNASDFIVGQDRTILTKRLAEVGMGEAVTAEGEHQRKDGTVFPVEVRIARMEVEGEDRFIAHARDVSDRRKAEEALKKSEEKYRLLADNAIDVIWTMDLDLRYQYLSPSVNKFRGITVEEGLDQTLHDTMAPETAKSAVVILQEELKKENDPGVDPDRSRTFEGQFRHKDGSLVWGEVTCTFHRDKYGQILGIQGVTRDISERKLAEEELRQSEERFRTAFLTSPDAISISLMRDGTILNVNEGFYRLTGWKRDEVIGKKTAELGILTDDSVRETAVKKLMRKENVENLETDIRRKEGGVLSVLMSASTYVLENETHMLTIARDITDLKEAQSSLKEAYHLLSTIIDSSPLGIVQTDPEGVIKLWNPAAVQIFGWKAEDILMKSAPTIPDERKEEFRELLDRVLAGEYIFGFETQRVRKDGTYVDVSISLARILLETGEVEVMGIIEDITTKKEVENALRESEERLRKISEGVFEGIVITENGVVIESNQQIAEMLGYKTEELIGKSVMEFVAPDWKDFVLEKIRSGFEGRYEHESLRKDGSHITVEVQGTNTTYQNKAVRVTSIRDITDQKRAESVLREREKRYRLLYENNPLSYQSLNEQGEINEVNAAWINMTGYKADEVIGRPFIDLISDEYKDVVKENFPQLLKRGEIQVPDLEVVTQDGQKIHVTLFGRASLDEETGEMKTHCLLHDITERTRMEDALKKGAQLAAVGQVASGIAHEINNPLATISASTEALLARLVTLRKEVGRKKSTVDTLNLFKEYLTMIMGEVNRSSQIIRDLLDFTRMRDYAFADMGMDELVNSTVPLLSVQSRMSKHSFEVEMGSDLPEIRGDRDRLRQVLIILLTNAVESMPDGGTIVIQCRHNKKSKSVSMSVADTGSGISREMRDHIFEPFYTTKEPGAGTGLGLSIADKIVERHNGRIDIKPNRGRGTILTVILPIHGPVDEGGPEGMIH
jgi:PAS domain S-box-containing protein